MFDTTKNVIIEICGIRTEKKKRIYDNSEAEMLKPNPQASDNFIEYANKMTVSHDNLAAKIPEHEILGRC